MELNGKVTLVRHRAHETNVFGLTSIFILKNIFSTFYAVLAVVFTLSMSMFKIIKDHFENYLREKRIGGSFDDNITLPCAELLECFYWNRVRSELLK